MITAALRFFVGMMYGYILLTLALYLLFVWTLVFYTKGTDFLGLADVVYAMTHVDMTQTHQDVGLGSLIFYVLMVGTVGGAGAIGLGHELSHRTKEPIATLAARVAGIPAAFTYYAIEHAQGHHCTVATSDDSSTALRGESLYRYFLRTMPRDYRMAWDIESERMRRMGLQPLSWRNRLLQGWLAETVVFLGVAWAAGPVGFLLFALAALWTHLPTSSPPMANTTGLPECRDPRSNPIMPGTRPIGWISGCLRVDRAICITISTDRWNSGIWKPSPMRRASALVTC